MRKFFFFVITAFLVIGIASGQVKSSKRGIAFGYHSEADMATISEGISWWYNWSSKPDTKVASVYKNYDMDFVPMTWNGSFNETEIRAFYTAHPEARYLLGFNEPNFTSQANMAPKQVAALWPKLEAIAADFNLEIVGPAVNYCDKCLTIDGKKISDPIEYLDLFFAACPDCKVDYIGVHNYMCYAGALSSYIERYKKYGKKIWLTEFACWDEAPYTVAKQKSYMMGALDYLENDTNVFRYAWFPTDRSGSTPNANIFTKTSGQLSELGELYVNYNPIHDTSVFYSIPARIEAESYTIMNGVNLEATSDFDGQANIGWIDANDWLDYYIEVPQTADYYISLRIACNTKTSIELREGDNTLAIYDAAATGGWQNWKTIMQKVNLEKGKHKLRVFAPAGGFNINWINISDKENIASPAVNAGLDQEITMPVNEVELIATASDADGDGLKYLWTKVSGPTQFTITNPDSLATTIRGLKDGKYIFKLIASDGLEANSDQLTINVLKAVTAVNGLENSEIKIFPNPVTDKLLVSFGNPESNVSVYLSDLSGRRIFFKTYSNVTNNIEIDFSSIGQGTYSVNVVSPSGFFSKCVVK